jgi:hypothetical protein
LIRPAFQAAVQTVNSDGHGYFAWGCFRYFGRSRSDPAWDPALGRYFAKRFVMQARSPGIRHLDCNKLAKDLPLGVVSAERKTGAPRSMKMGTTASPWRYDAAAD